MVRAGGAPVCEPCAARAVEQQVVERGVAAYLVNVDTLPRAVLEPYAHHGVHFVVQHPQVSLGVVCKSACAHVHVGLRTLGNGRGQRRV